MLNKKEKSVLESVKQNINDIIKILWKPENFEEILELQHTSWDSSGKMVVEKENVDVLNWSKIFELKDMLEEPVSILNKLIDGDFASKSTFEQKMNRRKYNDNKASKKKELIGKNAIASFIDKKKWDMQKIIRNKEHKSFMEGMKESKMTDIEVLKQAKLLKGNMKLGFKEDLKKEYDDYEKELEDMKKRRNENYGNNRRKKML